MNRRRRSEVWISSILVVVCLLLSGLVRQFRKGPRRRPVVADVAGSVSVAARPPASFRHPQESRRVERRVVLTAAAKSRRQPQARVARHPPESGQEMHVVLTYPSKACPPAVPPPQPKTLTLEPLGYVQKADGRVEAIISLEDRVHVVYEGEIFEDNFKVAKISSSAVELVENSAPSAESQLTAEIGKGVAQAPECKAPQAPPRPVPEVVSTTDSHRQFAVSPAAGGSQPSVRQELGYVERADGRVEAIVAEGEHVRLAPATKSFASNFRVPAPSPASLEVANTLPPPASPLDSVTPESQPIQANSSPQEVGGPPLVASRAETSTVSAAQGVPQNDGGLESEPINTVQAEPLADYSGGRLVPREAAPAPHAEPAGAAPSPATAAGVGQALKGGATPHHPSKAMGIQSEVNTLGYVEKAGGEKEAIVEVLGQIYLVREGELFAEKYRALQVTSSSVQIVDESTEGSSLPSEIERDSEAVRPPISRWRAPPLFTGSSGTDPPVKVGMAGELAAGKPVVSPSRPPPEHPVESCERPKEVQAPRTAEHPVESCERPKRVQAPRTGFESVHPAERPARTDTRSPPCALNTVGFVEKASGETEAIVADDGGVYLFRRESGIVALGRDDRKLCVFPRKRGLSSERVPNSPFASGPV